MMPVILKYVVVQLLSCILLPLMSTCGSEEPSENVEPKASKRRQKGCKDAAKWYEVLEPIAKKGGRKWLRYKMLAPGEKPELDKERMEKSWPIVSKVREEMDACFIIDVTVARKVCNKIFDIHMLSWGFNPKQGKEYVEECQNRLRHLFAVAKTEFDRKVAPKWIAEYDGFDGSPARSMNSTPDVSKKYHQTLLYSLHVLLEMLLMKKKKKEFWRCGSRRCGSRY